jgi:WD40 repeat protein
MATGATDALVTLWDTDSATPLATVSCLEYAVTGVSFSADGARVAISQERGPVVIARAPAGRPEGVVPIAASHCVAWHPKVPHLLAYGSDDAGVWNAEGRRTEAGGPIGLAFFGSGGGAGGGGGRR